MAGARPRRDRRRWRRRCARRPRGFSHRVDRELLRRSLRVEAISVGSRHDLEALVQALASGVFRPEIDRVFPFRDARAALEHLERGAHVGKVVVEIEDR